MFWIVSSWTASTLLCIFLALARDADPRAAVVCEGGVQMSLASFPLMLLLMPMEVVPSYVVRNGVIRPRVCSGIRSAVSSSSPCPRATPMAYGRGAGRLSRRCVSILSRCSWLARGGSMGTQDRHR